MFILIDVSVVVPVYNSSPVIERCIYAIKNQQGIDSAKLEIIVVDDASTDSSATKSSALCDRLIRCPKNSGAAAARNIGARNAQGSIIIFVDSDVILEPDAISKFLACFEKNREISAAVGRYSEKPANHGWINIYHNAFTGYHHDLAPKEIDWFWGALSAIKKEAFIHTGGFDERFQGASGEDLAFGKALFKKGYRIAYVPAARGGHAHDFNIFSMLENDYLKAVIGMKMKLSQLLPRQAPGFVNLRSVMTSVLLLLIPGLLLFNAVRTIPFFAAIIFLIFLTLMIINRAYYAYLSKIFDFKFKFIVPFIHWIQMYAMIAGAIMGVVGYISGRTAFGRPKWI